MEDGKDGASSMTERTCVIPRLANWFGFLAVERQVRYRRGAIRLATCLLCLALERSGRISCGCFSSISCCTVDGRELWYCWKKDSSKKGIPKLMKVFGCRKFAIAKISRREMGNFILTDY